MVRIYDNWEVPFGKKITKPCKLVCCDSLQERDEQRKKISLMYKYWFIQNIPVYKSIDQKDIYSFKLFDVRKREI